MPDVYHRQSSCAERLEQAARAGGKDAAGAALDRERALKAPVTLAVIARLDLGHPQVPAHEQWACVGGAVAYLLLAAKAGTVLANWDPLTRPIITEFAGKAKFENVEEGVTVAKQVDEVTGLSTLVVIDPKRRGSIKVVRPQVKLLDFGLARAVDISADEPAAAFELTLLPVDIIGYPASGNIRFSVRMGFDLATLEEMLMLRSGSGASGTEGTTIILRAAPPSETEKLRQKARSYVAPANTRDQLS